MAPEVFFPALNAFLNGTSAILLIAGYLAIRSRRITLHKTCMTTALAVSAAFLASYLYYHFVVRGGEETRFTGPERVRVDLLHHPDFAHNPGGPVVVPLAPTVAYLGFRDRLKKHVRIARWTLPLWIYVSITGVVIYWMLYQLYPAL